MKRRMETMPDEVSKRSRAEGDCEEADLGALYELGGTLLGLVTKGRNTTINGVEMEPVLLPDGSLQLTTISTTNDRDQCHHQSIAKRTNELAKRKEDVVALEQQFNILKTRIESGEVDDPGTELNDVLALKVNHMKRIRQLEAQNMVMVTYQQSGARVATLKPGQITKLSWLSAPVVWCWTGDSEKVLEPVLVSEEMPVEVKQYIYSIDGCNIQRYCPIEGWICGRAFTCCDKYNYGLATLGGLVYKIGGDNGVACISSVERYDPMNNTWSSVAAMSTSRGLPACVELGGSIFAIGGFDGEKFLNTVERYDPQRDKWTFAGQLNTARQCAAVVLGRYAYAVGGWDGSGVTSMERYDPNSDTWTLVAPLPATCEGGVQAVACGNFIYALGGNPPSSNVYRYEAATNKWTSVRTMTVRRVGPGAAVLDDHLYIIGGWDEDGEWLPSGECYDPKTNTWAVIQGLKKQPRSASCCTL